MDFFNVLTMIGGLALFLYGMNTMGDGLAKASGGRLERILETLTSNPLKAVLLGCGVTAVIQSSSATTVMVVGFVNSGIMRLHQAVGIIMGANIGTTATAWILSLSGIQSDNFFLRLLEPSSFAPVLGIIGVIFMLSKNEKRASIGQVLIGFTVLMTGMETISGAVAPLADVPEFTNILIMFSNPIMGVLAGMILTAIIQSSSASVGILQALSVTGAVTFGSAIPIIMGQNIGTCATAMLSSIGTSKNARRTALVHLYFNIIGAVVFLIVFYALNGVIHFSFMDQPATAAGIAVVHSLFNVTATLVLLPFSKLLEKLAYMTVPDDVQQPEAIREFRLLDERFLSKPGYAVGECKKVTDKMADLTEEAIMDAFDLIEGGFSAEKAERIRALETKIDDYEDELGSYLVKLSRHQLSRQNSQRVSVLLHSIGNLERISDHAVNLVESAEEMDKKDMHFSPDAGAEIRIFTTALRDIVTRAFRSFHENDEELARTVEPLEETIDQMNEEIKLKHIERLKQGSCTIELGFVLSDISTNYERISDHCSNLAVALLELPQIGEFDTHAYLHEVKADDARFRQLYQEFQAKYNIE